LGNFEPQLSVVQDKVHAFNQQLSNSYSPLQLVAMTAVATALGIGCYRFLFSQDEGK
jgi:hypothetical protein